MLSDLLDNPVDNVNEKREKNSYGYKATYAFPLMKRSGSFYHYTRIKNRELQWIAIRKVLSTFNRMMYSRIIEFRHVLIGKPDMNSSGYEFLNERTFAVGISAFTLYVQKLPIMNNNTNYMQLY